MHYEELLLLYQLEFKVKLQQIESIFSCDQVANIYKCNLPYYSIN
jgi:hypothetical protein